MSTEGKSIIQNGKELADYIRQHPDVARELCVNMGEAELLIRAGFQENSFFSEGQSHMPVTLEVL